MSKHIRLYNTQYLPVHGGIITHMQAVSRVLVSHGYQTDIVCDQCVAAADASVPVTPIPAWQPHTVRERLMRHYSIVRHLTATLPEASRVDLHWPREAHYANALLQRYGPENILYIMPTVYPHMFDFAASWGWKNRLRQWLYRPQVERIEAEVVAHCHVAVDSQARKDEVVAYYRANPERVHVVPLGIDMEEYGTPLKPESKDAKVLSGLTVARLSPEKGVHSLLEALAKVRHKQWQWTIVGDGWLRGELETMSKELGLDGRVRFVGSVDAQPYYAAADLFVLPSHYEGFGLVLLEAMASGLPCIAFAAKPPEVITASDEIIKDCHTGFVIEAMNIEKMAEAIDQLFEDATLRVEMGENGRQRCATEFTWERCVEGYLNISGLTLDLSRAD